MAERPILFSGAMVRALIAGTKTQTRRALRVQPPNTTQSFHLYHHPDPRPHYWAMDGGSLLDFVVPCPYGPVGDYLYVRETFAPIYPQDPCYHGGKPIEYDYRASYTNGDRLGDSLGIKKTWKPAIHMPRAASRILLEVTNVRVERLQDISEADAIAEGIERPEDMSAEAIAALDIWEGAERRCFNALNQPIHQYRRLWDQINGEGAWDTNPWVWAISFKRIKEAAHG